MNEIAKNYQSKISLPYFERLGKIVAQHGDFIATVLLTMFFSVATLQYLCILPSLLANGAQMAIGICSLFCCILVCNGKTLHRFLIFIGIYTLLGLICHLYNGNSDIIELIWPLGYMSTGLLLLYFRPNAKICKTILYIYCSVILLVITRSGDVDAAHFNASRNMISAHILIFLAIYLISAYKAKEKIAVLPFLCAIFLCVIARGRSGVVLGGIFAFYLLICVLFQRKSFRFCDKIDVLFCALLILIYLSPVLKQIRISLPRPIPAENEITSSENIPGTEPAEQSPAEQSPAEQSPAEQSPAEQSPAEQSPAEQSPAEGATIHNTVTESIANFQRRGFGSSRFMIWGSYIKKVSSSVQNIIFGAAIGGTEILDEFSTNLHNSFLMLHAKYGILGLLLIVFAMMRSGLVYLFQRNLHLLFLMAALFWRMNLDYTNFNGILDLLLVFLLFYPLVERERAEAPSRTI